MNNGSLWLAVVSAASIALSGCPTSSDDEPPAGGAAGTTTTGTSSGGGSGGTISAGGRAGGTSYGGGGAGGVPFVGDIYTGGLVFADWTADLAGGTGLPPGVDAAHQDFVRCVSCHGWDALGPNGGYVRRTANEFRPQPTPGTDLTPYFGVVVPFRVEHPLGRDWATMNNEMPMYSQPGGLTTGQVDDVMAYLNHGVRIGDVATLDIVANPVSYTFTGADTTAGATLYAARCVSCHGADGTLETNVSLGPFLAADGSYSEGFHRMVYGFGPTMTRSAAGDLAATEARDILAYIQANLGSIFPTN